MSDDPRRQPAPRAGPVAGLPIDSILQGAEEIARRWAIALVLARPLDGLAEVPLEELAQEAPALCTQLVLALESDGELEALAGARVPGGGAREQPARRLAAIAGARDAAALVLAVEALRGAVWETLLEELRRPAFDQAYARRVADVSDRLAYVCAAALAAALAAMPVAREAPPAPGAGPSGGREALEERGRVVIIDEREQQAASPRRRPPEIEIRDERAEAGPAAWIGSIGRELERFRREGGSFAVLLVELGGQEQLRRRTSSAAAARLSDDIEQLLSADLRAAAEVWAGGVRGLEAGPAGTLTRERPGRYWLLAPDTDRGGASALAGRIINGIRRLVSRTGGSLEVAIGTAVCPEDGREPAALAAHADLELYAARSEARTGPGGPQAPIDERL
jgi:GGDEF domain-containing protein